MAIKLFKYIHTPEGSVVPDYQFSWYEEGDRPEWYEDAHTIEEIHAIGNDVGRDFLFRKSAIKNLVNSICGFDPSDPTTYTIENFNKLDPEDEDQERKDISCEWLVVPKSIRIAHISEDKDFKNWSLFVENAQKSRRSRLLKATKVTSYSLSKSECDDLYVSIKEHVHNFKHTDTTDLVDWITNCGDYSSQGFAQKPYFNDELKASLTEIISKGIYKP